MPTASKAVDHSANAALRAGAKRIKHYPVGQPGFDRADIGLHWVFCEWLAGEESWCRSAFRYAGAA